MKTFQEFMSLCEATGDTYDAEFRSGAQVIKTGEGGRIGRERRKTAPERRRTVAIGGGQTAPAKPYKPRSDIGVDRPRSEREQQPEQERGTSTLSAKQAQRKAYLERKARERSQASAPAATERELEKAGDELLKKKKKKAVSPDYKPAKASGLSTKERNKQTREGERMLRGIMKDQETEKYEKATGEKPKGKAKTKILAHVERRMAN